MRFISDSLNDYAISKPEVIPSPTPKVRPPIRPVLDTLTLTPSSVVVALGAEAGRFTFPLGKYFAQKDGSGQVFAYDFSEQGVNRLRHKTRDAHLDRYVLPRQLHDVSRYSIPIENDTVDTIISINAIPLQDSPTPFIDECLRILKPCGSLFLGNWEAQPLSNSDYLRRFKMSQSDVWQQLKRSGGDICTACEIPGLKWAVIMVKPLVRIAV